MARTSPWTGRPVLSSGASDHLLFALLLLTALALPTLQPLGEVGMWLGIGLVMTAIGLSTWLPAVLVAPAIVLLWTLPFVAADLAGQPGAGLVTQAAFMQLAGLLFLGCGVSQLYRHFANQLTGRAAPSSPTLALSAPSSPGAKQPTRTDFSPVDSLHLDPCDALELRNRLLLLRSELSEAALQLRAAERA